jgi:Na+/H+-dicarboxylate symporter
MVVSYTFVESVFQAMYVAFLGTIYLRVLRCLVVPLIFPTVITAVGESSLSESKAVAWRAGLYYLGRCARAATMRWYFRKLMATGSLFLGINSSGGIHSAIELIPRRNQFFLYENF